MKNKIYVIGLLVLFLLTSCASKKGIVYFQEVEGVQVNDTLMSFEPRIQAGDLLLINVSAIDGEAAMPFNLYETPMIGTAAANVKPLTYLVDAGGHIQFPVIGQLKVAGTTTMELTEKLRTLIAAYIKNPIINIRMTNFRVTVLGQVKAPGTYSVPNERITIIEAIGLAGDLEIHGKRKNVMLIREQNGQRMFVNIDLTNKELFSSPYFFLSQNDVIYVEPNKVQVNASAVGANTGVIISVTSILLSLISIFLL
ncbi:polysaccharide export outer membrane protein [Lutibacter agarilyticus]|uniref:Polysaccharide export outer membrane protein n=1 Tax=Lutibacter agarilyticus TaxID=1109740 RepID=A0A238V7G9_9FLAO|nr:polysaccharide biosynthesis/export family protein [Lutibacter agarilyticus]SNR29997.1 polysaccharide export outer membrane protein [Lutibacter agarilyticus]